MGKGLDYDQLFPGRFIKSGEFQGRDVTLTIKGIRLEELPQDKGGERAKGIVAFEGTKKEWVLNRTNGECLKAMWGRDTGEWIGKRVTLFPAPFQSSFGDATTDTCIRVRGSPDLTADMRIEIRLPRKKPIQVTMRATGKQAVKPAPKPAPVPPAVPAHDPVTGEVDEGMTAEQQAEIDRLAAEEAQRV